MLGSVQGEGGGKGRAVGTGTPLASSWGAGVARPGPYYLACPDTLPFAGCCPSVVRPAMGDCYHTVQLQRYH